MIPVRRNRGRPRGVPKKRLCVYVTPALAGQIRALVIAERVRLKTKPTP